MNKGNRDAEHRKSVGKIRGAVQGIDVPAIVRASTRARPFLADNAMLRPARSQALHDQLLRSAIGLGNQVNVTLVFEADVAGEVTHQQSASFARNRLDLAPILHYLAALVELPFFTPGRLPGRDWDGGSWAM